MENECRPSMNSQPLRNYAFIDSQNLNLAIRSQGCLDFKKFRRYLEDKYKVDKAFLFIGYVPQNQDLYTGLRNVDVELVLHTMIEYPNYNKALIVTGDGDFYCLVDYLIKHDKLLKLMIPDKERFSSLFRKLMPYIVFMNNLRDKLEHKRK